MHAKGYLTHCQMLPTENSSRITSIPTPKTRHFTSKAVQAVDGDDSKDEISGLHFMLQECPSQFVSATFTGNIQYGGTPWSGMCLP